MCFFINYSRTARYGEQMEGKWSLSLLLTPTAFFILRWHWQANECFHLNTQTWLTVVWQRRRRKRNKDGKSFVRFFLLLNFKPIRTNSLICEDFLMVIKWLRKKRKFFKLKSLICCARAAGFFPFSWKIKSKNFLNGEEKMKWNQKFITMFCYRVVHTRQRVWTTLLHK